MPNKKRNFYAFHVTGEDNTPLDEAFAKALDHPTTIDYSKSVDAHNIMCDLLDQKDEKFSYASTVIDNSIYRTQQKQALAILRKVGKITGRSDEIEQELKKHTMFGELSLSGDDFLDLLDNAKLYAKNDESEPDRELSVEEINTIIKDSSLEEQLGEKSDPEDDEIIEYNISKRDTFLKEHTKKLQNVILQKTGFTEKELLDKFSSCIKDNREFDYAQYQKARKEFLSERMQKLDESDRTDQRFFQESDNLDFALTSCIFNGYKDKIDPREFHNHGNPLEFYKFAVNTTNPRAVAKNLNDKFTETLKDLPEIPNEQTVKDPAEREEITAQRNLKLEKSIMYYRLLKDAHKKRPFWTRFGDYFNKDGEDSTIKKMEKQLLAAGCTKAQIKTAPFTTLKSFDETTIASYQDTLTSKDFSPNLNIKQELTNALENCNNQVLDFDNEHKQMKNDIIKDISSEKDVEKDMNLTNEKTLKKSDVELTN